MSKKYKPKYKYPKGAKFKYVIGCLFPTPYTKATTCQTIAVNKLISFDYDIKKFWEPFCGGANGTRIAKMTWPNIETYSSDKEWLFTNIFEQVKDPRFSGELLKIEDIFNICPWAPMKWVWEPQDSRVAKYYELRDAWENKPNRTDFEKGLHHFVYRRLSKQHEWVFDSEGRWQGTHSLHNILKTKNQTIVNKNVLSHWTKLLTDQRTTIVCEDWKKTMEKVPDQEDQMVYIEPPYFDQLGEDPWREIMSDVIDVCKQFKKAKIILVNENKDGIFEDLMGQQLTPIYFSHGHTKRDDSLFSFNFRDKTLVRDVTIKYNPFDERTQYE
jgi:site-specific DNA-adenine methylase